ncbi:MAG: 5'-nucleotidase C-terminal domain-containing protein, partial [Desulfobulbaceae bacterium]|nr:5'-nucleotidase C-terminal domain-containing protein [Desulfobulbaceae bacterium]
DLYFFNLMEVDAMVTGNHEYDRGPKHLSEFIAKAWFPVVGANVDAANDAYLNQSMAPYIIRYIDDQRVGIVGLVAEEVPEISSPGKDVAFNDAATSGQAAIDQLERLGVNKIILLTHIYYENDMQLARQLHGADIIVGGHSHSLLGNFQSLGLQAEGEYPTIMIGSDGQPVLIVQAWEYGKILGVLEAAFDDQGHVRSYKGHPLLVIGDTLRGEDGEPLKGEELEDAKESIRSSPLVEIVSRDGEAAVQAAVYKEGIKEFEEKVVGEADVPLPHVRIPTPALPNGSLIAPAVCDAFLWKARSLGLDVDLVVQNSGGIRIDINQGPISAADVYTLLPFKNTLEIIGLSGAELRRLFEDVLSGVYDTGANDGGFPYVAGMRYRFQKNGSPGRRLRAMELQLASGAWEPMADERIYRVLTNSYLASGKSGYDIFASKKERRELSFFDTDILMQYLQTVGHIGLSEPRVVVE